MGGSLLTDEEPRVRLDRHTRSAGPVYDANRRSVYLPVIRSGLYDVFQAFDFADPSVSNGKRIPTTVAPQALFMMNDRPGLEMLGRHGRGGCSTGPVSTTPGRIRQAYLSAPTAGPRPTRRSPAPRIISRRFATILEAAEGVARRRLVPVRAWQALCQAILAVQRVHLLD